MDVHNHIHEPIAWHQRIASLQAAKFILVSNTFPPQFSISGVVQRAFYISAALSSAACCYMFYFDSSFSNDWIPLARALVAAWLPLCVYYGLIDPIINKDLILDSRDDRPMAVRKGTKPAPGAQAAAGLWDAPGTRPVGQQQGSEVPGTSLAADATPEAMCSTSSTALASSISATSTSSISPASCSHSSPSSHSALHSHQPPSQHTFSGATHQGDTGPPSASSQQLDEVLSVSSYYVPLLISSWILCVAGCLILPTGQALRDMMYEMLPHLRQVGAGREDGGRGQRVLGLIHLPVLLAVP